MSQRRVAIIEGTRTPFLRSGGAFKDSMTYDLGRAAVAGLLKKTGLPGDAVDMVVYGAVIGNVKTPNLAREVALATGVTQKATCHTVSEACISANQALTNAAAEILLGHADVAIVGGAEVLSDPPIQFPKSAREKLLALNKAKTPKDRLAIAATFRPADLVPDAPAIADFSTGQSMGGGAERLARRYGIDQAAQDEYAARSHRLAAEAQASGLLDDELTPVFAGREFRAVTKDDGVRGDTTIEKLAKLKSAFDRQFGTVTAGNSSFLTDGASAVLLVEESKAKALGLTPKAFLKSWAAVGCDPLEELLLGPVYATPLALQRAGLNFNDLGVLEVHEAFAVSTIAVLRLWEQNGIGVTDYARLNIHGGSLSLGHPFGATGGRLVTTCANRLQREGQAFGLVTGCAAGGLGSALILERA